MRKIAKISKIDTPNTRARSLSRRGTRTSIISGGVKLVL